ncbi:MAG: 4Fe-4S dicluster domain-containing protein [Cytophagaceae bacterium]|nr:4Fe-4S dicluster domain-containing protein [Cytophagaceae bacterium]
MNRKIDFGYAFAEVRNVDLNAPVASTVSRLIEKEPSLKACIGCGNCAAMCTAGHFSEMRFYRLNLQMKRGLTSNIRQSVRNCMLCGKCQLTCPRGVNIRRAVLLMSEEL